jgi:precorrin-2 dehydrogenase/sirohydrochlorin ferrochelatase
MTLPPLFPIALRLDGESCLVVGGGPIAARKAASLLECGAVVTIVAPVTCEAIDRLRVKVVPRPYEAGDLQGYRLVITATGDVEIDHAVFRDAEAAGVLANSADDPGACRFILPAVIRRGPVMVAVSTSGTSPYLAGWLRDRIGKLVGPEFAVVAALLADARRSIRATGATTEGVDWASLVDDGLVALVAAGNEPEARRRVDQWVERQLGDGGRTGGSGRTGGGGQPD